MTTTPPSEHRRYFSVIVGEDCNARCPFCVATDRMKRATEPLPLDLVEAAADYAVTNGGEVASVSGGGEPTLLALTDPSRFAALGGLLAERFAKRDLHSNLSIDLTGRAELFPTYTDVTVSLWPDQATNQAYMGYRRFDKAAAHVARDADKARFRLSAVLGTDWATTPDAVVSYVRWAKSLGASAVTLRTMQPPADQSPETAAWVDARKMDGAVVQGWLAERFPSTPSTLRAMRVFDVEGMAVCVYRYAAQDGALDEDFLFVRPDHTTGRYGLFTDYLNDSTRINLNATEAAA